jgi:DNA-binding NtrC family response regulator
MPDLQGNILIVDDSKSILTSLEILLAPEFRIVRSLSNPGQILSELRRQDYNLVLLDMNFSAGVNTGNEGFYWLSRIKEFNSNLSVVMITAYGDVNSAVRSLKEGACDFESAIMNGFRVFPAQSLIHVFLANHVSVVFFASDDVGHTHQVIV